MRHIHTSWLVLTSLLAVASATFLGGSAFAVDRQNSRQAATTLAEVDDDYPFQGEYYGSLPTAGGGVAQVIGIQVIARGNGEFEAVEFPGGLPGVGWYGGERIPMRGRREYDRVTLAGVSHSFVIAKQNAWCIDEREVMPSWISKVNRISRTLGLEPPPNAIVLFDGRNTDRLENARVTADGLLKEGASMRDTYRDYYLHLEFQLPYMPYARGQGSGNSGVYLQSRYEVQILDSFGLEGKANECGSLYRYRRPDVNMCLPPLAWQTYDILFRSPRFNFADQKITNARISVWQNGYAVHDTVELSRKTGNGKPETPELLPIFLQNHHNPVRFRNIWMIDSSPPLSDQAMALVGPPRFPPATSLSANPFPAYSTPAYSRTPPAPRNYWLW